MLYLSPENVRYLTGFTGSNGQVYLDSGKKTLFTDGRYKTQAEEQAEVDDIVIYQSLAEALAQFSKNLKNKTVYFESSAITVAQWQKMAEKFDVSNWQAAPPELVDIRMAKSADELVAIRKAVDIAESAYQATATKIQAGLPEREYALALEFEIRHRGSQKIPFEFIVASGERSAYPHGTASAQPIRENAALTLDFGAEHHGYYSDMTFSGSVGQTDPWTEEIIAVLVEAQKAAFAMCKPGVPVKEVDGAARQVIEKAGYGDAFSHSLGHGVGLAVHEAPRLSAHSRELLLENAVVTIEPGVYVAGKGGARLEDMVQVTPNGARLLTTIPKKHIVWS